MGGSKKTTSQVSNPWDPAQPYLKQGLSLAGDAAANTYNGSSVAGLSDWTTQGWGQAANNAQGGMTTNLANQVGGSFGNILGNGGLSGQQQIAGLGTMGAMAQAQPGQQLSTDTLSRFASGGMMGNNPWLAQTLQTSMQDAADGVNSQFSGAGRYGSGAHTKTLTDRLGNIEANARMGDYNTQMSNMLGAAGQLGNQTNQNMSANLGGWSQLGGIGQQGISNTMGVNSGLQSMNTAQNLDAANLQGIGGQEQQYNQSVIDAANQDPWTKAQNLTNIAGTVGSMGGTQTGTIKESGGNGLMGGLLGATGILKNLGGVAGIASMFSDERLKENIEPVGKLDDGQKIYAYNYKGESTPQIGLLAQEVEKAVPEAVSEDSRGMKMVNYKVATAKAAKMKGKH